MLGTEVLRKARETGYQGEVIILSGYTDFEYAREAMSCGAFSYLVKPVDERELQSVILQVRDKINNKGIEQVRIDQFYHKTREKVLIDLLTDDIYDPMVGYYDLGLVYPQYQVVIYEIYEQGQQRLNFAEFWEASRMRRTLISCTLIIAMSFYWKGRRRSAGSTHGFSILRPELREILILIRSSSFMVRQ